MGATVLNSKTNKLQFRDNGLQYLENMNPSRIISTKYKTAQPIALKSNLYLSSTPVTNVNVKGDLKGTMLGVYRWGMGGRINNFEVDTFNSEIPAYHSSDLEFTSYRELKDLLTSVRDGQATEKKLMAFVNSNAVVQKLKTIESYLEFLATELGYVHLNPGVIIDCAVEMSLIDDAHALKYPKQYIVAERISHYDSGFFGLILRPHNVINSDDYRHILIVRGTAFEQSQKLMSRKASTGLPLDLDYKGIALRFSEWPVFREMLIKVFERYKSSNFIFCGHSLGAIICLRIMNYFKTVFPFVFENSLVYLFNSPAIDSKSIPNVLEVPKQVINVYTDNDLIQHVPFFVKKPSGFIKLMRVDEKRNLFAVISNVRVIHKMAPFTKSSIDDQDLRFHLNDK